MPVIVMLILLFTAGPALAVGPYGDGTVTDAGTGLMWQQADGGTRTWADALSYCEALELPAGGFSDWRLPNIQELHSVVNYDTYDPAMDTSVFSCRSSYYWSATTYAYSTVNAWGVYFYDGDDYWHHKTHTHYVRCVRGGLSGSFNNLVISRAGTGSGTVTSSPAGTTCGGDCSESYATGSTVTLTAKSDAGSEFIGWGGACAAETSSICVVTLNQDAKVTAQFEAQQPVTIATATASIQANFDIIIESIEYAGQFYRCILRYQPSNGLYRWFLEINSIRNSEFVYATVKLSPSELGISFELVDVFGKDYNVKMELVDSKSLIWELVLP